MRSQRIKSLLAIVGLIGSISLTSCASASGNSQPVMIVFELGVLDLMPLNEELEIKVKGSSPIKVSDIEKSHEKNREMNDDIKWAENFGLIPDCDGWVRECGTFGGVKFDQIKAIDFFGQDSFVQTNLDVNKEGKAVLTITEKDRAASWEFETTQDSKEPIYLKILITDYYVGVTQLEDGFLTFTSTVISNEDPVKSYGFDEFLGNEKFVFQRPNEWYDFKAAYNEFSDARRSASAKACEIFGEDCDGSSSWTIIEKTYKAVYEQDISPMLENLALYRYSPDANVRKAVLMLSQTADLLASCYSRVQLAAQSGDNTSYNAVSICWQDVNQKVGDIEIYLSDFNIEMNLYPRVGDY